MIGDVKMQTIKRRTGRSLTGDRPLFLALDECFLLAKNSHMRMHNKIKTNATSHLYDS